MRGAEEGPRLPLLLPLFLPLLEPHHQRVDDGELDGLREEEAHAASLESRTKCSDAILLEQVADT